MMLAADILEEAGFTNVPELLRKLDSGAIWVGNKMIYFTYVQVEVRYADNTISINGYQRE